ncbi:unnamed protein product [Colias eurytheme]|nr:unnamed protein product [Colias eurytheme]
MRHTGQRKNCEYDSATLADNFSSFIKTQTANVAENVSEIIDTDNIEPLLADAVEAVDLVTSEGQACAYVLLSRAFGAHINVEMFKSIESIKLPEPAAIQKNTKTAAFTKLQLSQSGKKPRVTT